MTSSNNGQKGTLYEKLKDEFYHPSKPGDVCPGLDFDDQVKLLQDKALALRALKANPLYNPDDFDVKARLSDMTEQVKSLITPRVELARNLNEKNREHALCAWHMVYQLCSACKEFAHDDEQNSYLSEAQGNLDYLRPLVNDLAVTKELARRGAAMKGLGQLVPHNRGMASANSAASAPIKVGPTGKDGPSFDPS